MSKSRDKGTFLSKMRQKSREKVDPELQELMQAVQDDPDDMRNRLKLADAYLKREDKLRALDQYLTVAENYAAKSFYPKAVAVYKQALAIDPEMIEVYIKLAVQYQKLGLMGEVVAQYTKAAAIHEKAGRKKEAIDVFRMLIDLSPDNAVGRLKLGQRYHKEGFQSEAVAEFLKAADIFARQSKPEDQQKLLESLLDKGIEDMRIVHPLMELYMTGRRYDQVLVRLGALRGDLARSATVQEMIAHANLAMGQRKRALKALEHVVELYREARRPDKVYDTCVEILEIDSSHETAREVVETHHAERAAQAERRRVEEEAARAVTDEVDIEVEIEDEEEEGAEFEIAAEGIEVDESPIPGAVEEDVWAVSGEAAEARHDAVDVFGVGEPEEDIPQLDVIEHGYGHEDAPVAETDHEMEIESGRHLEDEEEFEFQTEAEEEAGAEADVDLFADTGEDEAEAELEAVEEPAEVAEEETPEAETPDLFAEAVPEESEAIETVETEIEEEIELPSEPETDVESLIPEVDFATLDYPLGVDHLRMAREVFESADRADAYDAYLGKMHEAYPGHRAPLAALRERAIETGDTDASLAYLYDLADMAAAEGDKDARVEYLGAVLAENPDDIYAVENLADALAEVDPARAIGMRADLVRDAVDKGDAAEAERQLAAILALDPDNLGAWNDRLTLARAASDEDATVSALSTLADLHAAAGDDATARGLIEEWMRLRPDSEESSAAALSIFEHMGDFGAAVSQLMRAAKRAVDAGEDAAAEPLLVRVLDFDPAHVKAREALRDVRLRAGDAAGAKEQIYAMAEAAQAEHRDRETEARLREALALEPGDEAARVRLLEWLESTDHAGEAAVEWAAHADAKLAAGDIGAAIAAYERALADDPAASGPRRRLAQALRKDGRNAAAVDQLFQLAELSARAGRNDDVEAALRDVLMIEPGNARAHAALKDHFITTGQIDQAVAQLFRMAELAGKDDPAALAHWGEIVGLDPQNARARKSIVDAQMAAGDVEAAVGGMIALANLDAEAGRNDDAAATLRQALKLRPDDRDALVALKDLYVAAGETDKAVKLLSDGAARLRKAGRPSQALSAIEGVLDVDPANLPALEARKDLLLELGETAKAVEALGALAAVHTEAGRAKDAEAALREWLKLAPADAEARERLAELYTATDRPAQAAEQWLELMREAGDDEEAAGRFAEKALAAQPDNAEAALFLVNADAHAGRVEEAVRRLYTLADAGRSEDARVYLRRAVELLPGNDEPVERLLAWATVTGDDEARVEALSALAALRTAAERYDEAVEAWEKVLAVEPDHEAGLESLVDLYAKSDASELAVPHMIRLAALNESDGNAFAAEEWLNRVLAVDENHIEALESLSRLHMDSGDTEKAIRELFKLAAAAESAGDADKALGHLDTIESLDAGHVEAVSRRRDLLRDEGREAEARAAGLRLAAIHIEAGRYDAAIDALRVEIERAPAEVEPHRALVDLYRSTDRVDEGVEELRRMAAEQRRAGDAEASLRVLSEAREMAPTHEGVLVDWAEAQERAGDVDAAVAAWMDVARAADAAARLERREQALRRAIELSPLNGEAQLQLRTHLLDTERTAEALELSFAYATGLREAGEGDRAEIVYRDIQRIEPDSEEAADALIDMAVEHDEQSKALERLWEQIERAESAGKAERMGALLKKAAAIDPLNPDVWARLVRWHRDAGRDADAVEAVFESLEALGAALDAGETEERLATVLDIDPDNLRALKALAELDRRENRVDRYVEHAGRLADRLAERGESEQALEWYRDVTVVAPKNADAQMRLAVALQSAGEVDSAASAYLLAAGLFEEDGDWTGAAAPAEALLELDRHADRALHILRDACVARGDEAGAAEVDRRWAIRAAESEDWAAAEEALRDLVSRDTADTDAKSRLADVLAQAGKPAESVRLRWELADSYARSGDAERRETALRELVTMDPDHAPAWTALADIHEESGESEALAEALAALTRIHTDGGDDEALEALLHRRMIIDPADADARAALFALYVRTGETDKASLFLFDAAETALAEGRPDEAIAAFTSVLEVDPHNEAAHRQLFETHRKAGRNREAAASLLALVDQCLAGRRYHSAETHLHTIFEIDPGNVAAKERLTDLFMHSSEDKNRAETLLRTAEKALGAGQYAEARARLDEVLALDPENPEAKSLVSAIYYRQPKVTRREVGAIFEDVEVEFQDQGTVDIAWSAGSTAEERPEPAEFEAVAEPEGVDLFGEASEESVEPEVESADVVDIFGAAAEEPELDGEEAAIAAAAEAADEGVDVFAAEASRAEAAIGDEDEAVDLFGAGEAGETEEAAPEQEAPAEVEEVPDLFAEAEPEIEEPGIEEPGIEEPGIEERATEREEEPVDIFGDGSFEETLEEESVEEVESETAAESRGIADLLMDKIIPGKKAAKPAGDMLDDFISGLEAESGHERAAGTGDFMADLAAEFRDMLGGDAPQDARAHFSLGIAFREMEQTADAVAEFEKALALGEPEIEVAITYQLAQCYRETEEWEQTIEYLNQTLDAIDGGSVSEVERIDVQVELAEAYKTDGKPRKALALYREVDKASPNYRGVGAEIRALVKQLGESDDGDDNISFV